MTRCKLSSEDRNIIAKGEWLTGDHIDTFGRLLAQHSETEFVMQETWKVQLPHTITAERADRRFIQILHSSEGIDNRGGHWVCAYYDTHFIFILDSLNRKKLHPHHKLYLQRLFPTYPFDQRPVKFPVVTNQPNSSDCGVFAIAFAISLFFGIKPETIQYEVKNMRQHLLGIFDTGIISHFPRIFAEGDSIKICSLKELKRRREKMLRNRFLRQSNQRDHDAVPAKSHKCVNRNATKREKTVAGQNHLPRKPDLLQVESNSISSTSRNIQEKIISLNHSSMVIGIPQLKLPANAINLKLPIVAQIQETCFGENKLLLPKVVTFAETSGFVPYDEIKQETFTIDLENKENQEFFYETGGKNHPVMAVRNNKDSPLTNDSVNRKKSRNSNSMDAAVQNCQKLSKYCIKSSTPS
nr:hypothetical protein 5 [Hyposoter didymator ichnovirus]